MDPIDSRLAARATADAANETAKLTGMDIPIIMMSCEHARALIEHRAHLITRVDELQTRMSAMALERQRGLARVKAADDLAEALRSDPNDCEESTLIALREYEALAYSATVKS